MLNIASAIEFPNLHIRFENLPKTFSLFGIDVAFYGLIIAIGMLAGIVFACYEAKRTGQDYNMYINFALFAIIVSVICARLYYVIFKWENYNSFSDIINIREGGLAIYGGVIGAFISAIIFCKIKKYPFGKLADTGILGLLIGQIIGRWGNFFNREAFGGVVGNKHLLAMRLYFGDNFSASQVPDSVAEGMSKKFSKSMYDLGYVQVQPTFLYESMWNLALLIVILIFRKKKAFDGEVLLWYLGGYGLGRFIIEGFRSDQLLIPNTNLAVSQCLSFVMVIVAVAVDIFVRKKKKDKVEN